MKEWTDAEITTMKILWEAGKTARHIGAVLHRSRNSIIGKMNRIGAAAGEPKPVKVVVEVAPPAKAAGCQFPLGDYPYHSCGEAVSTAPNQSTNVYCAAHYKRCYRQRLGVTDKFKVEGKGRIYPRPVVGWGSHMTSVL
jgi:hypothetical protein